MFLKHIISKQIKEPTGIMTEKKSIIKDNEAVEKYWINEPYAIVKIIPNNGSFKYVVEEAVFDPKESEAYEKLASLITKELVSPETLDLDLKSYVLSEAKRLSGKYKKSLGEFSEESWGKIYYYIVRDLAGYGIVDVLMNDSEIEDISCNGLNIPFYIWHRKYENIPSNVEFNNETDYDNFIVKLAHMSGKHISSARPMLDAILPEGHRLAATFMKEVSTFGSSFCIRKFRSEPFSIVDMLEMGTINEKLAAYFWVLMENKMSSMVIGGTGAGKTSMLNTLLSLIKQNDKIVTVEDIAELNTVHENWVQLTSRRGFRFGGSDETSISLFDLVKLSLRYRPDYLIVGEIRGEEAYSLFQALATGHGGLCTMHADSLDHATKRLTSEPMNVSEVYLPLMNICIYVSRVELPKRSSMGLSFGRRVINVWEILDFGKYNVISEWSPIKDTFSLNLENSFLLSNIAEKKGLEKEDLIEEVKKREKIMLKVWQTGKKSQSDVTEAILRYYKEM